jgi:2-keto-4-pentenoate hydratase/2-oxohepta-3-ene-1,7-dioic acid hydratase in catechol pathway
LKLATFRQNRQTKFGILLGDKIIDFNLAYKILLKQKDGKRKQLPILDMKSFLSHGHQAILIAKRIESWIKKELQRGIEVPATVRKLIFDLHTVKIVAPLSNPPKFLCLARNYISHAKEVAGDDPLPKDLMIFMKPLTAIIGPGDAIVIPPDCNKLDHEVELAVVIGKRGRYIPEDTAMDHVAGYTIFNDLSDREYISQKELQRVNWFFMKAQDTSAPIGPYIVLKDEVKDPHNISLRLFVNGELRQDGSTKDMIFNIPQIIARISHFVTLEPGDIIATGTPSGTSFSTKQYLKAGDIMKCEIEGMGILENSIKVEKDAYRWK